MSRLRARCPDCGTLTAVAIGPEYQCHVCGAGVRPGSCACRAPGAAGGDEMAAAAALHLPYPEAAVVARGLARGADARRRAAGCRSGRSCRRLLLRPHRRRRGAREPPRPLRRRWVDAHGDLNTPESSPSGNPWGMPLRMLIDSGAVAVGNVCLVGARDLDPPEEEFIAARGSGSRPTGSPARSRAPTASTSRSTATRSTRWRSPRSCRSRTG